MREIKFRAWDKTDKAHKQKKPSMLQVTGIMTYVNTDEIDISFIGGRGSFTRDEFELMQYFEIIDAYEGDILTGNEKDEHGSILSSWVGIVKYNKDKGRVMIQDDLEQWFELDDFDFDRVIGNIFENPELITETASVDK